MIILLYQERQLSAFPDLLHHCCYEFPLLCIYLHQHLMYREHTMQQWKYHQKNEKNVMRGLRAAAGWLRHELGENLNLRYTPELQWQADDSIVQGAHILDILSKLDIPEDEHEDAEHS